MHSIQLSPSIKKKKKAKVFEKKVPPSRAWLELHRLLRSWAARGDWLHRGVALAVWRGFLFRFSSTHFLSSSPPLHIVCRALRCRGNEVRAVCVVRGTVLPGWDSLRRLVSRGAKAAQCAAVVLFRTVPQRKTKTKQHWLHFVAGRCVPVFWKRLFGLINFNFHAIYLSVCSPRRKERTAL